MTSMSRIGSLAAFAVVLFSLTACIVEPYGDRPGEHEHGDHDHDHDHDDHRHE